MVFVRRRVYEIILVVLFLFGSSLLFSVAPQEIMDKATEMIDENKIYQEERNQEESYEGLKRKAETLSPRAVKQFELDTIKDKDLPKFYVSNIILLGDFLKSREIKRILNKFNGKKIDLVDIQNLIRELTNYYISKGYFTTRVQLKVGQDISKGKLILSVFPGKIQKFSYRDSLFYYRTQIFMVYPFVSGDIPNINKIDAGLAILNRLPSNNFVMKIVPGDSLGWSNVLLDNKRTELWRFSYLIDDKGSKNTGKYTNTFSLGVDNIFCLSDNWNYSYNENLGYKGIRYRKVHSLSGSIPFGTFLFTGNFNWSKYLMTVEGSYLNYQTSGNSRIQSYGINKEIYRTKYRRVNLGLNLGISDEANYLEDTKLNTSSFRSSNLSATFSFDDIVLGGMLNSSISFFHGLDWFGSKSDSLNMLKDDPRAEFEKYKFTFFWSKGISSLFNYSLYFNSQYAGMTLYGGEEFSGGGVSDIKGISLKNSLSYKFRNLLYRSKYFPVISTSIAFEYGHVQDRTNKIKEDGGNFTTNMSLIWDMMTISADYNKPLFLPCSESLVDNCTFRATFNFNDIYKGCKDLFKSDIKIKPNLPQNIYEKQNLIDSMPLDTVLDSLDLYEDDKGFYLIVADNESLYLYAKWFNTTISELQKSNKNIENGNLIFCTQKVYLPQGIDKENFLQKRLEFLGNVEKDFWRTRKLVRLTSFVVKDKRQLWSLAREDFDLPYWLLQRYNRDINLKNIEKGQILIVPIVETK